MSEKRAYNNDSRQIIKTDRFSRTENKYNAGRKYEMRKWRGKAENIRVSFCVNIFRWLSENWR